MLRGTPDGTGAPLSRKKQPPATTEANGLGALRTSGRSRFKLHFEIPFHPEAPVGVRTQPAARRLQRSERSAARDSGPCSSA